MTEGGFGATGNTGGLGAPPAIEGGFGAAGGDENPTLGGTFGARDGTLGGLGTAEIAGPSGPAEAGSAGLGTGFGGKLIIAVSRGPEAAGWPSRRGGRTIRTVSFLGSDIVS